MEKTVFPSTDKNLPILLRIGFNPTRSTSPCYNPTDPIVPKSTNESRVADLVTDLVADLLVS